jgi:hypothetical protein
MIMQDNIPSSMNNICAKNQTASERNELSLARNNKGTTKKSFWYRNDVSINLRIDNSSSMIMHGNVPSSMNNICAKNQTASERNESSLAHNNKGTTKKAFWYQNDVSINLRINNSSSMIMHGNVPSSMNNICAKNQTASEWNESLLAHNNKGTTKKAFWYQNDVSINLRINNSSSMIMHGNVPSSMNNICAKNQTASEGNELSFTRNNKGTIRKAFWYRNDVSIKLKFKNSSSMIMQGNVPAA